MKAHARKNPATFLLRFSTFAALALSPSLALAYDCHNKQVVVTDSTVSEQKNCAEDQLEDINTLVTFADSGCSEYKSILSDIKRIQTNAKTLYSTAKTTDSSLKSKMDAATSELGTHGKAEYRIDRYENWWKSYKSLLSKYSDTKDKMEEAGKVTTSSGSAGKEIPSDYAVTYKDDLPCTTSSPSTSSSNTTESSRASTGVKVRTLTPTRATPSPSPSPLRSSVPSEDLDDECSEFSTVKKTFCDRKYECILWKEVR